MIYFLVLDGCVWVCAHTCVSCVLRPFAMTQHSHHLNYVEEFCCPHFTVHLFKNRFFLNWFDWFEFSCKRKWRLQRRFLPPAKFKRNTRLFVRTISAVFMNDWRRLCGNRIKLYSAKSSSKTGWTLRFVWNKDDKKNTRVPPTLEALTCRRLKSEGLSKVNICVVTSHQPQALAGGDGDTRWLVSGVPGWRTLLFNYFLLCCLLKIMIQSLMQNLISFSIWVVEEMLVVIFRAVGIWISFG